MARVTAGQPVRNLPVTQCCHHRGMDLHVGLDRRRRPERGGRRLVAHAVPSEDRTRSAVCGSSVRRTALRWEPVAPDACPECLAVLQPARTA